MKNIIKTLRTSLFANQSWRSNLNAMLLNYRAAPHSVTGKPPSMLLFGRIINNKLPSVNRNIENSVIDTEVRNNQREYYDKAASRFDKTKHTKSHEIKVDQHVLMKRTNSKRKLDAKYYQNIFKVIDVNGNVVTVESELGNKYTRQSSFFKVVETAIPQPRNEANESLKLYPKRNRTVVQRFTNNSI